MEERISELDDKLHWQEKSLTELEHENVKLTEKLERQKLKRKMDQWLCATIEEYQALEDGIVEEERKCEHEIEFMRKRYRKE